MRRESGSPQSLAEYLWHWERESPDRLFTCDNDLVRYSYADAAGNVRALSAELNRRGVGAGDMVVVLAENSAAWIVERNAT